MVSAQSDVWNSAAKFAVPGCSRWNGVSISNLRRAICFGWSICFTRAWFCNGLVILVQVRYSPVFLIQHVYWLKPATSVRTDFYQLDSCWRKYFQVVLPAELSASAVLISYWTPAGKEGSTCTAGICNNAMWVGLMLIIVVCNIALSSLSHQLTLVLAGGQLCWN